MINKNADIFTFRHSSVDSSIVDDVPVEGGFRNPVLDSLLSDDDLSELVPYIFGYVHMDFN